MTTPAEDAAPAAAAENDRPAWAEDLKDEILGAVEKLVGGARTRERGHLTEPGQGHAERAESTAASLNDQIAAAVDKIEKDKAAAADASAKDERLAALEARPERAPVDRRRVHHAMGWGENE
jgi:hypothetical protein